MDVEIMSVYVNRDNREYSFAFVRDIAQRKQNELALRESDKRYRLILQNANDAIFIHEISHGGPGRFIEVNDHACRMLGYTRDELLQMGVPDIDVPEIKEKVPGIIEKLFSSGNAVFQTFHLTKDRRRIPVEVSNRLIGLDGRPAVLSIVRDLSDLKRTEEAAQAANRKLRLLNSITRHDIQNKVTILTGYLSLAREKSTNPMMVSYIEKLESAVKSISDHVEFTKIYQDLGTTEPQWQDLGRAMPRPADIHQVTFDADMDGIMVYADPTLAKVFSNLLDNTLRHGGHAKTIRVSAHESENGLTVVWQDDGVGIPEKEKEKIFLQGYGKNTGLGLFLCREILSITGMTIKETGKPANGARFEIFVPTGIYKIDKRV
jgi:PAS domain S-box-containing protein